MKIRVDDVRTGADGRVRVAFSSSAGSGSATWRSADRPCHAGKTYDVEIDVAEPLVLDRNASILPSVRWALSATRDRVRISGTIDVVGEDGLVYLRLAQDCVIMIEADPGAFRPGQSVEMDLPTTAVELVPFGG